MRYLNAFAGVVAATLMTACGTPEGAGAADQRGDPGPSVRSYPAFHATSPGPGHMVTLSDWDVGVGLVRIAPSPDGPPGTAPSDTILIFPTPSNDGSPVGRAHHDPTHGLVIEATEPALLDGALEVGYEERALPVVRTGAHGRWAEVSYAFTADGEPRTGWVDTGRQELEIATWDRWLAELEVPLFFRAADSIAFFNAPEGEPVEIALATGEGTLGADYIVHPVRVEDGWMEVRVVSPSDYCHSPSSPMEATAWIRHLTEDGRPRVWYFTRGC